MHSVPFRALAAAALACLAACSNPPATTTPPPPTPTPSTPSTMTTTTATPATATPTTPAAVDAREGRRASAGEASKKGAPTTDEAARESERKTAMDALAQLGLKGVDAVNGGVFGAGGIGTRGVGAGGGGTGSGYGIAGAGEGVMGRVGVGYGRGGGMARVQSRSVSVSMRGDVENEAPPPAPGGTFVHAGVNPMVETKEDRFSTFGIDVDSGSWLYAKRFLKMGRVPAAESVRVEEFVNAVHYDYAGPQDGAAFAVHVDAAPSPFTRGMDVVRVAIQGKRLGDKERKPAHVTFLVDVSGSMDEPDKLPWAKEGIDIAVDHLRDDDSVAIVTYAGDTRLVLPATRVGGKRDAIHAAVATLRSNGGTNMGSGMELAYREADKELGSDRSARVIVLSDGDANIGRTTHESILASVKGYVSEGVTMSTMGFGSGNYNDNLMEQLADAGNGNYTYIDSKPTLTRFFADELTQTLEVIAQDAKIQVEWNPDVVARYRLVGYENRDIADKDFRNDKVDAGEIGAGHAVTALYEIERRAGEDGKLGTVRIRHKVPRQEHATEIAVDVTRVAASVDALDNDAKAALGMALASEILRGSEHAAGLTLADAARLLRASAHGAHASERNEAASLFEKAPRTVAAN